MDADEADGEKQGGPESASVKAPRLRARLVIYALAVAAVALCAFLGWISAEYWTKDGLGDASTGFLEYYPVELERTSVAPVAADPGTWLIMIYADADDEVLEDGTMFNLNEAESVGSTEQVKIVTQIDRYADESDGEGDFTSARRYLLTKDDDLQSLGSEVSADLGEVDMGSVQTLYDFVTWAVAGYPAERYVLIMSDHGAGWDGGWVDSDPGTGMGTGLSVQQIDRTLGAIVADTGIGAFELVGLDACLMGQMEVMSALAPHSRYAVASEETEAELGWNYAGFLRALTDRPSVTGRKLAEAMVDSYLAEDDVMYREEAERLLDEDFDAEVALDELRRTSTLAAIDLSRVKELHVALNRLVVALTAVDQGPIAKARACAQSYGTIFSCEDANKDMPPSFIDLGNFVDFVAELTDEPGVATAARQVERALAEAVFAEKHGEEVPGSSGLAIYFPDSEEYPMVYGDDEYAYASCIGRFATASLWDDYLTLHYTAQRFDVNAAYPSVVIPSWAALEHFARAAQQSARPDGVLVVGPGSSGVSIAPLSLSAGELTGQGPVTISTEIAGANIAYVRYFVAYAGAEAAQYVSVEAGYIQPPEEREVGGVVYPDWGDGDPLLVQKKWRPSVRYLTDGHRVNDQFACVQPFYDAEADVETYVVMGTFTFVDTGISISAQIGFDGEGEMLSMWGYGPEESSVVPKWHELTAQAGDIFTVNNEFVEFCRAPGGPYVAFEGGTITFSDRPLTLIKYHAPAGEYIVGVGIEDMDGHMTWEYANLTVVK